MRQFDTIFEQIFQGIAKGKTLEQIANKHNVDLKTIENQLEKGQKVEMEHTKDKELAKKIAMDHLYEIPDYYDKLQKMEK
jgi:hypothetical protein